MNNHKKKPAVLIVCDGWGEIDNTHGNAINNAKTPRLDALRAEWPHVTVEASGEAVGLPEGQMGNSEVGHLTIGSGRIKLQPLTRQIHAVKDGSFMENKVLIQAVEEAKRRGSAFHIMGLLSSGGVHSYDGSAFALVEMAKQHGLENIYLHAFTDGRDVAPTSFKAYLEGTVMPKLTTIGAGKIASISGRYYAMDRDNRWDRIEQAYNMLVADQFESCPNVLDYVQQCYDEGVNDEFIKPMSIADNPDLRVKIEDNDVVVFFNFRPDRARQLSHALCDTNFEGFARTKVIDNLHFVTIAEYDTELGVPIAFPEQNMPNTLAEIASRAGLKQLHIAETEKYAHVTYFMNGGNEQPFPGEERILVASPKVATYDLKPEMSAPEVRDKTVDAIKSGIYDLIIMNFANADMVGHTGVYEAAIQAINILDNCVADVIDATLSVGGVALMTADHGNAEQELDQNDQPVTAHSTNPVPVLVCGKTGLSLRSGGGLRDIAPTILEFLGLDKPAEMTGSSLIDLK